MNPISDSFTISIQLITSKANWKPLGKPGKKSACNAGGLGSIPGLERSPGDGKGYPLQYSDLENSTDCAVHVATESDLAERLSLPNF